MSSAVVLLSQLLRASRTRMARNPKLPFKSRRESSAKDERNAKLLKRKEPKKRRIDKAGSSCARSTVSSE